MNKDTARKHLNSAKALLGLTNRKIAEATGVCNTTVGRYVNGEADVTEEWAKKFCEAYHIDFEWLKLGSGEPVFTSDIDNSIIKNVSVSNHSKFGKKSHRKFCIPSI